MWVLLFGTNCLLIWHQSQQCLLQQQKKPKTPKLLLHSFIHTYKQHILLMWSLVMTMITLLMCTFGCVFCMTRIYSVMSKLLSSGSTTAVFAMQLLHDIMEKSEQNHDSNEWRLKQWNKTLGSITHGTVCMCVCIKSVYVWHKTVHFHWLLVTKATVYAYRMRVHLGEYPCISELCARACACASCMFLYGAGLCECVLIVLNCRVLDLHIGATVHQEMGAVVHELFDIVLSIAQTHK